MASAEREREQIDIDWLLQIAQTHRPTDTNIIVLIKTHF